MADSDVVSQSSGSPLSRKRARDESRDVMESVHFSDDNNNTDLGILVIPEAKKHNVEPLAQDADLMALLDRIEQMESFTVEDGDSGILKSSEEASEIGGIMKQTDSSSSIGDGSDVGDLQAYGNFLGEFDFNVFLDSADELAMGLNQFPYYDGDLMAAVTSQSLPENAAYNDSAAEVSLWEDDIWQLTDAK